MPALWIPILVLLLLAPAPALAQPAGQPCKECEEPIEKQIYFTHYRYSGYFCTRQCAGEYARKAEKKAWDESLEHAKEDNPLRSLAPVVKWGGGALLALLVLGYLKFRLTSKRKPPKWAR